MPKATLKLARAAKQRAAELFGDLPGLVGIGVCKNESGDYAVKINLDSEPTRAGRSRLPKTISGVPVAVEIVGRVKPR